MKLQKYILKFGIQLFETIVFVGSIYMVIYLFVFRPGIVNGISMEPTFKTEDRFIVSRIEYRSHSPLIQDIVVLPSPQNNEQELVKRVIGLPGDTIQIKNGAVYRNKEKLTEPYVSSETYVSNQDKTKTTIVHVPDGEVFVLGDNRMNSRDSRAFGTVPIRSLIGKAVYRYFPLNKMGSIQ